MDSSDETTGAPGRGMAWPIFAPFLAYAAVDLLCRMANATLAPVVIEQLALGPSEIGFVNAAFFIGFGLTQFPMGIALDRYGPSPVVVIQLAVAALGALVCFAAESTGAVALGRALMGIGFAGSFMAAIKAASLWLPPARLPLISALIVTMTGLGGMLGTLPITALLERVAWRDLYLLLELLILVLLIVTTWRVPSAPRAQLSRLPIRQQVRQSAGVFTTTAFWRFAPIAMTSASANVAYQTLWAPIWLREIGGLDAQATSSAMFGYLCALTAGGLLFGWLSQVAAKRGWPLLGVVIAGVVGSALAQLPLALGHTEYAVPLWLTVGFLYACPVGVYAYVALAFRRELAARASASLNMTVFLSTFSIQWGIGAIIGLHPPGAQGNYSLEAFRTAMLAVIALQCAGVCAYAILKDR